MSQHGDSLLKLLLRKSLLVPSALLSFPVSDLVSRALVFTSSITFRYLWLGPNAAPFVSCEINLAKSSTQKYLGRLQQPVGLPTLHTYRISEVPLIPPTMRETV